MPDDPAPDHTMCGLTTEDRIDAVIAAVAASQHGVVSRRQLLAAGGSARQIDWRLKRERLHLVHRGVYSVGHAVLSQAGIWMAAVLAGGQAARLSFWSSASLLRLRASRGPRSHVTCPRKRRSTKRITFHEADLRADEVTEVNGIPTTTPARTALDLAAHLAIPSLTRMVAAIRPHRGAPLSELLDRYPRKPGAAKLRAIIAKPIAFTRSDLEAAYLERFEAAGLSVPRVNATVAGYEVDFVWVEERVIAELDTYMTHGSREAFENDRTRDRKLTAAGWIVVRLTDADPDDGLADLSRLLAASAARSPSRRAAA